MLNNGQETRCWYKENSPVPCAMRTPCGDEFRYEYDDDYRLSVIASEFGERSFGYDSLDHIVSDTDALDNTYTAEFDLMGNLRRECSPKEKPVTNRIIGATPMMVWTIPFTQKVRWA